MKKFFSSILCFLLLTCALGFGVQISTAEDAVVSNSQGSSLTDEQMNDLVKKLRSHQNAVLETWGQKTVSAGQELDRSHALLDAKVKDLADITTQIDEYNAKLEELRGNINSLQNQLLLLDNGVKLTGLKIRNSEIHIAEKEQDILENYEKVTALETMVADQERIAAYFIGLLFKQNMLYFSSENNLFTDPTFFLSENGISSIIASHKYAGIIQQTSESILEDLKNLRLFLDIKRKQLDEDQNKLKQLNTDLRLERVTLEQQKESKEILLAETRGKEESFSTLVAETQKEEDAVQNEVRTLQSSVADIESKLKIFSLNTKNSSLTEAQIKERALLLQQLGANGKVGLDWPVQPDRGIAAFFHDPSYFRVFGVQHNAIDIPTPQGTDIHAPADAYVTKVKDNGYGYSYIMLAHNGGIMTLYGHVSEILVEAGDLVHRGDIIGRSGATPGTKGAGWMTTGPHLHFEVFLNGEHVNPLDFLDRSVLDKKKE